ncbi:MAG TPA: NADH-quinone oxidoreductase subunit NuoE [Hyphomicrobiaceae bacterium]|nr:NADH-quinone oxidoreductase subunit NuoE [Hyphomicrobiaceae bacterium]
MAVRRLHPDQPPQFDFSPENLEWAKQTIAKYPPGKQASAVLPVLWRAQEQHEGWLPEPAIRYVADMLGMAYIRVLEVATFYTMFQLSPVGKKAHVQVCGTTPCMLRGAEDLIKVCKSKIHHEPHHLSADGDFSWEEVECLGSCANAPMVQIWKDTYEDLTPELFEKLLEGFAKGNPPKAGSQIGRTASCPQGGPTTLADPSLYDGSTIGAWQKRFADTAVKEAGATGAAGAAVGATPAAAPASPPAAPASAAAPAPAPAAIPGKVPELLTAPREGKGDDLTLIWGVAEKLQKQLNDMGIWHFDQIAKWSPEEVAWFEATMQGFKGRVERDKWIEQCQKLAQGWRPDHAAGERPKE